jgi:hypothetical protein
VKQLKPSQVSDATMASDVVVQSVEASLYIIRMTYGGDQVRVSDAAGNAAFRSLGATLKVLGDIGIPRAQLLHTSAYDEMIGQPADGENILVHALAVPVQSTGEG